MTNLEVVQVWIVHKQHHATVSAQHQQYHSRHCHLGHEQLISWVAASLHSAQHSPGAASAAAIEQPWLPHQAVVQSRLEQSSLLEQSQLVDTLGSSQLEVGR